MSVNPIGKDGKVGEPQQVIPTARNAHSIITDRTNRFAFVPHLGTDQIFQFVRREDRPADREHAGHGADEAQGTGPRHIIMSADNKFAYLLNELTATVTTLSLDAKTGLLTAGERGLGAGAGLEAGAGRAARRPQRAGRVKPPPRDVSNDIWASDLHLTPNGKFLYAAERTGSTIGALERGPRHRHADVPLEHATEPQPRGFRIDPTGSTMVVSPARSRRPSRSTPSPASGALTLLQKYPTGKGSNWVEIVSFD